MLKSLEGTRGYELCLAVNDIEHTKAKARHPQTNGICERFHETALQEFYQVAFRTQIYAGIARSFDDLVRTSKILYVGSSDFATS